MNKQKILLLVIDGLGDRPDERLNDQTPLEAARTPYLNYMAERGATGLLDTISVGVRPGSDTAHLALLGYDPAKYYSGRGPIEAAGVGLNVGKGDVAFRTNFASILGNGQVVDRRAGRIESSTAFESALNKIKVPGFQFAFKAGCEHRGALVVRGKGVSPEVSSNDPGVEGNKEKEIKPTSSALEAKATAAAVEVYLKQARRVLASHPLNKKRRKQKLPLANTILLRGAGAALEIISFKEKYGLDAACIAGGGLYRGVAKTLGMDLINANGATGGKDSNILAKVNAAKTALARKDFIFIHMKGADEYGHDGDALGKKAFIERVDAAVRELLTLENTVVAVTADHSTPCQLKAHSGDPVPLLLYGKGVRRDCTRKFGERDCAVGGLGRLRGLDLMPELMNISGRAEIYGA